MPLMPPQPSARPLAASDGSYSDRLRFAHSGGLWAVVGHQKGPPTNAAYSCFLGYLRLFGMLRQPVVVP